jgi:cell division transport system permease protein
VNRANVSSGPRKVSRLAEHRRDLLRAGQALVATRATTAITVLIIGIALLLPSLLLSLENALSAGLARLEAETSVNVFLEQKASQSEASELSKRILTLPLAAEVKTLSPDAALADLALAIGLDDSLAGLEANPLPYTLIVTIEAGEQAPSAAARSLAQEISALAGVESVSVEGDWLRRLEALSGLLNRGGQLLMLLVSVGLLAVIGASIQQAVLARIDEIRVSQLIGAEPAYLARPFLYIGLFLGAGGGVLAWLLASLVVWLLNREVAQLLMLYGTASEASAPLRVVGQQFLVGAGALLGWIAAQLATRRAIAEARQIGA